MASTEELDLFLFTYNCGKRGIDPDAFISKLSKAFPKKLASLYVFGVEELCSVMDGTSADIANHHFITLDKALLEALNNTYGSDDINFHSIGMAHIGAIGIIAITPYPLQFSKIRTASSGCGYFYSSLKGAAGLRLEYSPLGKPDKTVELSFADAHLSAYEGEYYYTKRNAEVIRLMRSLDFGDNFSLLKPNSHCFFMGDLNYRTTKDFKGSEKEIEEIRSLQDQTVTTSLSIEDLVQKYDELSYGIKNDEVFMGFTEGCINFQPTYKYHTGTAIYNAKRAPSWCDRILYQSTYNNDSNSFIKKKERNVLPRINDYDSLKTLFTSDHHPVYLSITIPFKAPELVISSSGYLKILPNDQIIDHFHRDKSKSVFSDTASGPTQVYVKSTRLDRIIQYYVTPFSDSMIGNALWFATTPAGRLTLLVAIVIIGGLFLTFLP